MTFSNRSLMVCLLLIVCEAFSFSMQHHHHHHQQQQQWLWQQKTHRRESTTASFFSTTPRKSRARSHRLFMADLLRSGDLHSGSVSVSALLSPSPPSPSPSASPSASTSPSASVASTAAASMMSVLISSPQSFFNSLIALIVISLMHMKWRSHVHDKETLSASNCKPASVKLLQRRYLSVFWLLRMADWLQGPYFFEVYSSKMVNGTPASVNLVSQLFLVGFATTAVCGPYVGRMVDQLGRRSGTIAYLILYCISALSTRSNLLPVLFLGRIAGGLGTSLLFSAPEAWMVGEHQRQGLEQKWLSDTFRLAFGGDALVAVAAGQLATVAANKFGPTGPFIFSVFVLVLAFALIAKTWSENTALTSYPQSESHEQLSRPTIREACNIIAANPIIMLIGMIQALFEGAMYIFVLQWPPMIKEAMASSPWPNASAPFGTIFSVFMTCCLGGATAFGNQRDHALEMLAIMLLVATGVMTLATNAGSSNLIYLTLLFSLFEVCVGIYFPSIGMLRSQYFPSSHRSVLQNIFGVPLNLIVITVFLSIHKLGHCGALACGSISLGVAAVLSQILMFKSRPHKHKWF